MIRWAVLGVLAIGVVGAIASQVISFGPEVVRIPYDDAAAVDRGRTLYMQACVSCHGRALEGQPAWRNRLANGRLPAPPHDETGHTWHHPDKQLFDITKYGTARFASPGYQTDMMGFEGLLSDEDILSILAFIKASWPESVRRRHSAMSEGAR